MLGKYVLLDPYRRNMSISSRLHFALILATISLTCGFIGGLIGTRILFCMETETPIQNITQINHLHLQPILKPEYQLSSSPPIKIVFLLPYLDYLTRMNTYKYEIVEAAIQHPSLDVHVWGPTWNNYEWDQRQTMSWNMKKKFNCTVDIVITFQNFENTHYSDDLYDGPGCNTIWVHEFGDCHYDTCVKEWFPYHGNITLSKYSFELFEMFNYDRISKMYPGMSMQLFGHSPESANEWQFYPSINGTNRTTSARLFGSIWDFYPIRMTINSAISESRTFITLEEHPGYIFEAGSEVWSNPPSFDLFSPLHFKHRENLQHFASQMRDTKICVFDGSLERKMIRKYVQAMLSGCVIAADIPDDMPFELQDAIIPLKQNWDIEKINNVINETLMDEGKLFRMSNKAYQYALKHYTATKKLENIVNYVEKYRNGLRGYIFPSSMQSVCRKYMTGSDGWTQPWCR